MQTDKSTQCYSAVLIFESSCPAPDYDRLYEEQLVLLRATSIEEAREKANAYGKQAEHSYENGYGETITISFKQLVDVQQSLYEGEPISTGSEVYSRYFRDYSAYEHFETLLKGQQL